MKKISVLLSVIVMIYACGDNKKSGFELKGKLSGSKGEMLYFEKLSGQQPVVLDSTLINEDGTFEFTNYTPKIGFYRIKLTAQNFAMLVLDSSDKVMLTGDIADLSNSYQVDGSAETKLFLAYNALSKKRDLRLDSLNKAFQMAMEVNKMDSKKVDSLSAIFEGPYNAIVGGINIELIALIKQNAGMYATIMAIQSLEPDKYADVYKLVDEGLSKSFPGDRNVMMFHEAVIRMQSTTIGQLAPDIIMLSPEGNEIALSSLRGKIVLVDFWASWCGPCRKEMPNVVKAYAKYKNKGFEVFGVSLDQDRSRWEEAIAKDGMTWPQVSDLKYWESAAAKMYNVQSIPYTVLLDKEGRIIDKNLRGESLDKKLEELLN